VTKVEEQVMVMVAVAAAAAMVVEVRMWVGGCGDEMKGGFTDRVTCQNA
jgi:hypothetical protein